MADRGDVKVAAGAAIARERAQVFVGDLCRLCCEFTERGDERGWIRASSIHLARSRPRPAVGARLRHIETDLRAPGAARRWRGRGRDTYLFSRSVRARIRLSVCEAVRSCQARLPSGERELRTDDQQVRRCGGESDERPHEAAVKDVRKQCDKHDTKPDGRQVQAAPHPYVTGRLRRQNTVDTSEGVHTDHTESQDRPREQQERIGR